MWQDFKAFIMRGNVLDLAVAVVIGAAFGGVVKSLVDDVLMPPLGLAVGKVDFSNLYVVLKQGTKPIAEPPTLANAKAAGAVTLNYGAFLNTVFGFVIIAFAVFVVVRIASKMYKKPVPPPPNTKACPYCATQIPIPANRCPNCTSEIGAVVTV